MLTHIQQIDEPLDLKNKGELVVTGMSFTLRYALLGALFGLLFPLMAIAILLVVRSLPFSLVSVVEMQRTEPLLWIINTAPFFLGLFASFAGRREDSLRQAYALLKQDERELQEVTKQLQVRTEQLLISADVSRHLSAIINLNQLLVELAYQIKRKFGYYVYIYLFDEERKELELAGGTGLTGKEIKNENQDIAVDTSDSLVARAASTGIIARGNKAREGTDKTLQPFLPDVYAEMAVPIKLGEQVVGVMDVLKDEIAGFDEGDADLFRTLANQVAVAIRNARLFARAETALAEVQGAQERYIEQSWGRTGMELRRGQYLYVKPNTPPPDEREWEVMTETEQKALTEKQTVVAQQNLGEETLAVPINLRNKTIGTLQLYAASKELTWNEEDVALVEAVVDQLAQTAENLRLFDETRQRANREQSIRQITDKMRAATSLDELTKITAEELGRHFSTEYASVELGVEDNI